MDFGREKGVFPLVLIQVKSAAKRTVFGLKNKREKTFLPFKAQLFHIQIVRYAASESNTGRTPENLISDMLTNPDYCNSLQFSVNTEKEKRRISPSELCNKHFVLKKVYAYNAKEINQFKTIPDCIEDLSYKLNLLPFCNVDFTDIIPSLRNKKQ